MKTVVLDENDFKTMDEHGYHFDMWKVVKENLGLPDDATSVEVAEVKRN